MLANLSIRYMTREIVNENGGPVTIKDMLGFLDRLAQGQCNDFTVLGLKISFEMEEIIRNMYQLTDVSECKVQELRNSLCILVVGISSEQIVMGPDKKPITCYFLNGYTRTLTFY
jgi:hypothetical protein